MRAEAHTMAGIDADLEQPDEWGRSCWRTTEPADSVDACPRGYKHAWNTGLRWYNCGNGKHRGYSRHCQALEPKRRGMGLCRLWLQMVQSDWAKGYRERRTGEVPLL